MTANEIYEIIQNHHSEYDCFGLRAVTKNPVTREFELLNVGDTPNNSYVWDDGETTEYQLAGTSALAIDNDASIEDIEAIVKNISIYDDRAQVVLLGSWYVEYGDDPSEIIMHGHTTVLAEWKK